MEYYEPVYRDKEDPLRILRAIRFATVLNFKLSQDIDNSIFLNIKLLKSLSKDRVRSELNNIYSI